MKITDLAELKQLKRYKDHEDLKGFSRPTIYRQLPQEIKPNYTSIPREVKQHGNVSNETFVGLNKSDEAETVKLTTEHPVITDAEADEILEDAGIDLQPDFEDLPQLIDKKS